MVISKIAIQFTDGLDTFEAEAFDKLAREYSKSRLNAQGFFAGQFFVMSTCSSAKNDTNAYANKVSLAISYNIDRVIPQLREAPHLWLQIVLAMAIVENGPGTIHLEEALSAMKGMGYVINMGTKEKD